MNGSRVGQSADTAESSASAVLFAHNGPESELGAQRQAFLVIGETALARRVCATLGSDPVPRRQSDAEMAPSTVSNPGPQSFEQSRTRVTHLLVPGDAELARALGDINAGVAILVRDDVAALRYALAVAHLDSAIAITVTIFDKTIADRLRTLLPRATVISPAELAAPSLAGPCLGPGVVAATWSPLGRAEVRLVDDLPVVERTPIPRSAPWARASSRARQVFRLGRRHPDPGTRLFLAGLAGLVVVFLGDWSWLVLVEHHTVGEAFLDAAQVVATVGPGGDHTGGPYGILSGLAMLATIGFTALFTAGLVERMIEPRLVSLVGVRTVPRSDHVIVVGMGQVGIRLCSELRALGVSVVGVERDPNAPHLRLAHALKIPVVIGHGADREVLERLGLSKSRGLAAVGSDDLDNVAVAVAASAISPSTRVVLRAGEQEAIAETRSLLPLGVIRDVTEIVATLVVSQLRDRQAVAVVAMSNYLYLQLTNGRYQRAIVSGREDCRHGHSLELPVNQLNANHTPMEKT